jgi:hypothetical protein
MAGYRGGIPVAFDEPSPEHVRSARSKKKIPEYARALSHPPVLGKKPSLFLLPGRDRHATAVWVARGRSGGPGQRDAGQSNERVNQSA